MIDLTELKTLTQQANPFALYGSEEPDDQRATANGEFFVAAVEAIPVLIDKIERIQHTLDAWKSDLHPIASLTEQQIINDIEATLKEGIK